MRVGIVILPEHRWADAAPRWRRAEDYGFDHAWTYDHLGWRTLLDDPWFDSVTTLTAAATVTSKIPLGFHVASPNFRHPVSFARQLLTLDDVSVGRLRLGIGAGGGGGYDDTVMGQAPISNRDRLARMGEFIELTDLLLRQPVTDYAGRFYEAQGARSHPGPRQQPRPPIYVAANGPRSMAIAARYDGWVTIGPWGVDDVEAWWVGVAELAERFSAISGGRQMERHLSLDASPQYSLASAAVFDEMVGRAAQLGFTDVIVHWPRAAGVYAGDESILDTIAERLG